MLKLNAFSFFVLLSLSLNSQINTINFDTGFNWTAETSVALSSYGTHSYNEANWAFSSVNSIRQGTTAQDGFAGALGTYSWRLRDASGTQLQAVYNSSATISQFGFDVRRWDNSPDPSYDIAYSTNSGSTWTTVATTINNAYLVSSDWKSYSFTFGTPVSVSSGQLQIRITRLSGERIMIDNFTWTSISTSISTIMYNENFHQANIICCEGGDGNTIGTHESNHRFSEDALTYSGTGDMDINSSTWSSGYSGASGGFNTVLNSSGETLIMAGLDLSSCGGTLSVNFGVKKSTNASDGSSLDLQYSTTGSGGPWTSIAKQSLPTGSGTTTTWHNITSFGLIPTTATALRWIVTDAVNYNIDDIKIICSSSIACAVTSQPTTNSSSIVAVPSCNSVDISFTAGNGNNRMIVMSTDCTITDPADLTSYLGNRDYGTGSTTSANDFVVYTGSGNSVNVFNLQPSTTYCFKIFEYNKKSSCTENYLLTATTTSFTTSSCGASLTGVMVNSCSATCLEGNNELVFGNAGSTSFLANSTNLNLSYGFDTPLSVVDQYTDNLTTVAATTSALNTASGCPGLFIEGTGATIPANASFMIASTALCEEAFDWTSLCGFGPIYVIYTSDPTWNSLGNFTNDKGQTSNRYFKLDITNTLGTTTSITTLFNTGNLTSEADGDYITFDSNGGFATSYSNNGCTITPIVLPIELNYFDAYCNEDQSIDFKWSTSSEKENSHFIIEQTINGVNYIEIAQILGAGNSSSNKDYFYTLNSKYYRESYYRLKQVDFDGKSSYSHTIYPNCDNVNTFSLFPNPTTGNFYLQVQDLDTKYQVIDNLGRIILDEELNNFKSLIDLSTYANGIYQFILLDLYENIIGTEKIILTK